MAIRHGLSTLSSDSGGVEMTIYGYARGSTTGQTLATQKALLRAAGVTRIFSEKVSGVSARRPELERVLDELEAGDVLVVTRLARSTLDLLRMVDQIGREGAGFRSLGEPWAEPRARPAV